MMPRTDIYLQETGSFATQLFASNAEFDVYLGGGNRIAQIQYKKYYIWMTGCSNFYNEVREIFALNTTYLEFNALSLDKRDSYMGKVKAVFYKWFFIFLSANPHRFDEIIDKLHKYGREQGREDLQQSFKELLGIEEE